MSNKYTSFGQWIKLPKFTKRIHILSAGLIVLLSSCVPISRPTQTSYDNLIELDQNSIIGQSFTARYDGLTGIAILILSEGTPHGEIEFKVLNSKGDQEKIYATRNFEIIEPIKPSFHEFQFSPLPNSSNQDYFLEVSYDGEGKIFVGNAPGETYLNGALYLNGSAQDTQLAFKLSYNLYPMFLGLAKELLRWVFLLGVGIFSIVIPGWSILDSLFPKWANLKYFEKFGIAVGVGVSIYPLLYLWTDFVNIHPGPLYAWLPPLLALLILFRKNIKRKVQKPSTISNRIFNKHNLKNIIVQAQKPENFLLFFILFLIFISRFWPIGSLAAPMWGDSYHHTVISQLLIDNQGLFTSWQPYTELNTFTYHFGFHTLVANFSWLTGLSTIESVLWVGQILNFLSVISLYPLATRIGRNKWSGIIAIAVAGLFSRMPMVFINWGRYTQLTGLVILISAVFISWNLLESRNRRWSLLILTSVTFCGLALTHYRIFIFSVLFFGVLIVFHLNRNNWQDTFSRSLSSALLTAGLFLPWFLRIFDSELSDMLVSQLSSPANKTSITLHQANAIGRLSNYLPAVIWFLLILAFLWGIIRREKGAVLFGFWWILILLTTNPHWLGLPGEGYITNFATFISIYIPSGILIGAAAGWLLDATSNFVHKNGSIFNANAYKEITLLFFIILIITISLIAARLRITDVNPNLYALVTNPDIRASEWIKNNLPKDSKFLVNTFPAYGDFVVVGADGGWWLPLLSRRSTNLPPINYGSEDDPKTGFKETTNSLVFDIQKKGLDNQEIIRLLIEKGFTHIYIGQRQGSVNNGGAALIDQNLISSNPAYGLVYKEDLVRIFEIINNH